MEKTPLTGAEKTQLRSRGQLLGDSLKLGKGGLNPGFFAELQRQLKARELVKLRFHGLDRDERAALCTRIAQESDCDCVGAVGHTALFYRRKAEAAAAGA